MVADLTSKTLCDIVVVRLGDKYILPEFLPGRVLSFRHQGTRLTVFVNRDSCKACAVITHVGCNWNHLGFLAMRSKKNTLRMRHAGGIKTIRSAAF